ncbi:MAG TPA: hypothetical protein VMT11_13935 [Myxococcaceae bacterium]|nr:hypothetical protein [Myxococcaceae bacterium]
MRRTILFAFFLLAACGGGVRKTDAVNQSPSISALRQAYLLSAEGQAVIADFAKTSSEDALDSCLNAWVEDAGGPALSGGPVAKPDAAGFRAFLSDCLGSAVPGDARSGPISARGSNPAPLARNSPAR